MQPVPGSAQSQSSRPTSPHHFLCFSAAPAVAVEAALGTVFDGVAFADAFDDVAPLASLVIDQPHAVFTGFGLVSTGMLHVVGS